MTPQLRRAFGLTPGQLAGRAALFAIEILALILLMVAVARWGAAELARVMETLP